MEHVRTVTREFQTGEKAVLHVEARSGAVEVEARASNAVRVEAVVHVWSDFGGEADDAAALVESGMEQDEHRVIVRTPALPGGDRWTLFGRRGARVDYVIQVPIRSAVRVLSRSGQVRVTGNEGRVHVEASSGRCQVTGVRGDVTAVSRSGSVQVERVDGDVTGEARSGRIEVREVSGSATLEARSGAADVANVGGALRVSTHTGAITIAGAGGPVRAQAHTGAIRFRGRVAGDLDMKAHTGLIHLAVDPDYPFFLDAESHLGSVRSELPPRKGGRPGGGDGPKVRLRTHTGSIRLTRA